MVDLLNKLMVRRKDQFIGTQKDFANTVEDIVNYLEAIVRRWEEVDEIGIVTDEDCTKRGTLTIVVAFAIIVLSIFASEDVPI